MRRDRSIFITGAASGIGRATAELFHREGWLVGAHDVNGDGLDALRQELGDGCVTAQLDVRDKQAFDAAMAAFGARTDDHLDLMFNNAGIAAGGPFDQVPFQTSLDIVDINLVGVLNGVHAAIPLLKRTENSLCFTTSSSAALFGTPGLAVYSATKFAVFGLTEALSVELAPHGVRAADVLPGIIDTAIWSSVRYEDGEAVDTLEIVPRLNESRTDASRTISPDAVAECVLAAYHDDQLHWYVPPELQDRSRTAAESAEQIRDRMIAEGSG
ncbi:MAG: SDR family oxidoreductase [Acidimicrobiia bacterium]|nr:SDR family oxidoreductase [Acidimicrobiia bacterium]